MKSLIVLFVLAVISVSGEKVLYNNYRVYRVNPTTDEQAEFLHEIQISNEFDFWTEAKRPGRHVDVMVSPEKTEVFEDLMNSREIGFQVHIHDVQKILDKNEPKARRGRTYGWDTFYNLEETYAWLRSLNTTHPGKVSLRNLGKSYEKRDILAVKISTGGVKKAVLVDGGFHAREWSGVSTATYLINQLLTSDDPAVQNLANSYDWYIIPVANPDGYHYSHSVDRFWRKTRQPHGDCFGADPNRNFDYEWIGSGQFGDPCLPQYAGPEPFSEPESKAFAYFVKSTFDESRLKVYISLHSYGQVMLYPYGYTWQDIDNVKHYEQISQSAVAALAKRYGTKYDYGSIFAVMYQAFGNSIDWMKGNRSVPLNFAFELRDRDDLDPKQIVPCGEEVLDSFVALLRTANDLGYFK